MEDFKRYAICYRVDNLRLDSQRVSLTPFDFLADGLLSFLRDYVNEHAEVIRGEDFTDYEIVFDIRPVIRKK